MDKNQSAASETGNIWPPHCTVFRGEGFPETEQRPEKTLGSAGW